MARYGYANVAGASLEADEYVSANLYGNGLGEAPTASYSNYVAWAPGTTPAPPDPLSFAGSNDNLYSMYVTTDDEMVISSGSAYVQWLQEFDISARMLIYDGDGNLLGASDVEEIAATEVEGAWQDFTFSTPIDVGPEDAVAIAIWSERPDPVADLGIFYDSLEDWEAPIEPPGPGGTSPAGPLFTGGGML